VLNDVGDGRCNIEEQLLFKISCYLYGVTRALPEHGALQKDLYKAENSSFFCKQNSLKPLSGKGFSR